MKENVVKKEKKANRSAKTIILTLITLILLSGTMFYSTTEARAQNWHTAVNIGLTAAGGAILGGMIADGPGAIVGAAAGAIGGWLHFGSNAGQSQAALNAQAQAEFAESLRVQQQNEFNLSNSNAENMYQLYNTSAFYFVKKAEWGAKKLYDEQTANEIPYIYDGDRVLEESQVSIGTLSCLFGATSTYSAVLTSYGTVGDYYYGTYEGMYTQLAITNSAGAYHAYARSDPGHSFKALSTFKLENGKYYHFGSYPLYIVADTDGTYTINATDINGDPYPLTFEDGNKYINKSVTMNKRDFLIINVTDPSHTNETNVVKFNLPTNLHIFGFGAPSITNKGYMYPAVLGFQLDKNTGEITLPYVVYKTESSGIVYLDDVIGWQSNAGGFTLQNVYGSGTTDIQLGYMFNVEENIINQVDAMITTANNYALTTYNALVNGILGDIPVYPDTIFPDPSQLDDMNATDAYAVWIAYMRALYDEMQNHTRLDYRNINISAQSFNNLRVIGTIQDQNGTYIAGSNSSYAVFIPYISIQDMNLTKGINIMNQSGFAIILKSPWYSNTTQGMEIGQITYVPLKPGYVFDVTGIEVAGNSVDYTNLNITKLQFVIPQLSSPAAPPQFSTLTDALIGWFREHLLTSIFLCGGIGALIFLPAPSNKTWGFILLIGAAAMYFFIEPALADPLGTIGKALGFTINYWRW